METHCVEGHWPCKGVRSQCVQFTGLRDTVHGLASAESVQVRKGRFKLVGADHHLNTDTVSEKKGVISNSTLKNNSSSNLTGSLEFWNNSGYVTYQSTTEM